MSHNRAEWAHHPNNYRIACRAILSFLFDMTVLVIYPSIQSVRRGVEKKTATNRRLNWILSIVAGKKCSLYTGRMFGSLFGSCRGREQFSTLLISAGLMIEYWVWTLAVRTVTHIHDILLQSLTDCFVTDFHLTIVSVGVFRISQWEETMIRSCRWWQRSHGNMTFWHSGSLGYDCRANVMFILNIAPTTSTIKLSDEFSITFFGHRRRKQNWETSYCERINHRPAEPISRWLWVWHAWLLHVTSVHTGE